MIINANRVLTPDRIIDELWGETPPESGAKAVVFHVGKLREILEPERAKGDPGSVLVTGSTGYMLKTNPATIDAVRFEELAAEGRSLLPHDPGAASGKLRDALAEWRGDALAEFTYEPFAQSEIRRLEELRLQATENRLDADLELGRHDVLVGELERLVGDNPLRERLRGQLMLALYRSGHRSFSGIAAARGADPRSGSGAGAPPAGAPGGGVEEPVQGSSPLRRNRRRGLLRAR